MSGSLNKAPRQDANSAYMPHVPDAVRKAARASEDLVARVKAGEVVPGQAPDGRDVPTLNLTPFSIPSPTNESASPETQPEPSSAVAPPPPTPAPTNQGEDWEQKFRSLQGRFDSQVPVLAERARAAETQAQIAQARVRDLEAQLAAARAAPPAPRPGAPASEEDVKTWGEDFIATARRQARAEMQGEIDAMRAQLAEVGQTSRQAQALTQRERTNAQITRILGSDKWLVTNGDPAFVAWLQFPDNFSGVLKHTLLSNAYERGDAATVANFFRAFDAEHTAPAPTTQKPAHTPAGAGPVRLEDLAAPGVGGGSPPAAGGDGAELDEGWVTQKEIAQHYQRYTQGYYRNNPSLYKRVSARIDRAVSAGRVR
jgi:hypothetical protein